MYNFQVHTGMDVPLILNFFLYPFQTIKATKKNLQRGRNINYLQKNQEGVRSYGSINVRGKTIFPSLKFHRLKVEERK